MQDFLFWFGLVANAITVLAGLIAIAGVVWAFLGRARLTVTPAVFPALRPHLTVAITSTGSNAVRDLELSAGTLLDNGFSMMGDRLGMWPALNRGETLSVFGYEPEEFVFGSPPRDFEIRFEIQRSEGLYLTVQWRSTMFPWRRSSRTYVWSPASRFACELPEKLAGRRELKFLKRTRNQALNPTAPGFVPSPHTGPSAIVATDETFDNLVAEHSGPVMVGFGPTWQGALWEDVKRILAVLAVRNAPRVRVLVVNTDECPQLAERYATDVVPVFKVLVRGQVTKSHEGALPLPELEHEFEAQLR